MDKVLTRSFLDISESSLSCPKNENMILQLAFLIYVSPYVPYLMLSMDGKVPKAPKNVPSSNALRPMC